MNLCSRYWWVFLILWVVSKILRHVQEGSTKKIEKKANDAEAVAAAATVETVKALGGKKGRKDVDKVMNGVSSAIGPDNVFKEVLASGVEKLLESGPPKEFTPVNGSHPLEQLAKRAVESEEKKEKVKSGLKKAGRVGLSILKGLI